MNSFIKIVNIVLMPKTDFVHRFNNLNILFIKPLLTYKLLAIGSQSKVKIH